MDVTKVITKRLDSLPFSRWHFGMILAIGTIWIFDGYEVSLVSLFSDYILNDHSESEYKSLATLYQLGCIVGGLLFGVFAYFYGRKAVFMTTLFIYAVGVVFCLLGDIFPLFMIGRLLTGLSVGGQFTAIFTAVDEFLPPKVRGRVDIAIDGTWHLGGCIASIINLAIGQVKAWKNLFAIGFFGLIGLAFIRRSIPESPRWLIMKGRYKEAQNIVSGIQWSVLNNKYFYKNEQPNNENINVRESQNKQSNLKQHRTDRRFKQDSQKQRNSSNFNRDPKPNNLMNINHSPQYNQFQESLEDNLDQVQALEQSHSQRKILYQILLIFKQYKMRFIISCLLIFVQGFFFNSVYYQFPVLLKYNFKMSQRQISGYMLGLSICSFISTLIVGPFFDIIGRRKMLLLTYGITGILLPFSNLIISSSVNLQILTCVIFMFGSPASSAANLVASEIFPTSTRPIVLSAIFVIGMFGGMCGVWVNNYYASGALMIFGGIMGFCFCPRAQNKSLEEVNAVNVKTSL